MTRERIGQVVFLGAAALAAALYAMTVPQGVPWNESTHWAMGYLGGGFIETALPAGELPHPIWGRFVQVFGGNVALSCACAALGAGLLGALVNRYLGWRAAVTAAIVWIFHADVWNRAITGERGVVLAAMIVAAAWMVNAAGLWVTRKVRAMWAHRGALGDRALPSGATAHEVHEKYAKINRVAGWVAMGAAGIFAVVSMSFHDYRLGEAASVFARGVVEEAGDRIIVANGLVDEQIGREVKLKVVVNSCSGRKEGSLHSTTTTNNYNSSSPSTSNFDYILLRNDEVYRAMLVAWVRREWPGETNLWVAAEVSPTAFVQVAERRWPERFYLMNGASTTAEGWEKRWNDFAPYLKSSDRFVAVAKIAFAHEGEAVAKRLEQAGDRKGAKRIREQLPRVREKVVVNSGSDRKEDSLHSTTTTNNYNSLIEWSNEMVAAMERGDRFAAGRIARAILSNPQWTGYIPANAIMGTIASSEGDYLASAAFFAVAVSTTNAVPPVVLNDYADTLMHLGRMEAAERMARRAVKESEEDFWLARLTLAEVLRARYCRMERVEAVENGEKVERYQKVAGAQEAEKEIAELVKAIGRHASKGIGEKVRRDFGRAW